MKESALERRLREKLEEEAVAESASAEDDGPEQGPGSECAEAPAQDAEAVLRDEVAGLKAQLEASKDQLLRARADFENYRKRVARDSERTRQTVAENLFRDLLPVIDNLELALNHRDDASGGLSEGLEMVHRQFCEAMTQHGLTPIPALGEDFDPNVHEAVTQIESDAYDAGKVAQELLKGYRLGDLVLRPSKVIVSLASPGREAGAQEE